jgi:hypothetical protein
MGSDIMAGIKFLGCMAFVIFVIYVAGAFAFGLMAAGCR